MMRERAPRAWETAQFRPQEASTITQPKRPEPHERGDAGQAADDSRAAAASRVSPPRRSGSGSRRCRGRRTWAALWRCPFAGRCRRAVPRAALARDLCVDVEASGAQRRMVVVDVLRRQRAMGLVAAGGPALARWDQRDGDCRSRRAHLDPATALTIGEVCALLEPELVEVELERSVLVGDRDEHRSNLADTCPGCRCLPFQSSWCRDVQWDRRARRNSSVTDRLV
jgi:hypothetical protein